MAASWRSSRSGPGVRRGRRPAREAGHVNAALELEGFRNELGREIPFSLYCGYPWQSVEDSQYRVAISEACRLHTAVVGRP